MKKNTLFTVGMAAALLAFGLAPCTAAFAQAESDFIVELTEDSEGVVITGYTGTATAVKIPAVIQGMPVREIRAPKTGFDGIFGNKPITSVVIPEGVTKIGKGSFQIEPSFPGKGNDKLTQVTLPSTLQIIGESAFSWNTGLKSIVIPEGVTEIGRSAFSNCSSLASVTLPKSLVELGSNAFTATAITSITLPPNLTKIADGTFLECKKLTSIVIPEGVTEIEGGGAFRDCTALVSVTLPATIVKIGGKAFSDCSALTTITIPDTVEKIEMEGDINRGPSFEGCGKISLASQARLKKLGYTGGF